MINVEDYISTDKYVDVQFEGFYSKLDILMYYVAVSDYRNFTGSDCKQYIDGGKSTDEEKAAMFNVYPVTNINQNTFYRIQPLNLQLANNYFIWVMGTDKSGECSMTSREIIVDTTYPESGELACGPDYNMAVTYTPESTSLTVSWENYRDPESDIKSYDISLWFNSSCSDDNSQSLLVDWIELSSNYSQFTFTELELKVLHEIKGEDAIKLMALFTIHLNEDAIANALELVRSTEPPEIKIVGKASSSKVAKKTAEKWEELLTTLHFNVITGSADDTLSLVQKIIKSNHYGVDILPMQYGEERIQESEEKAKIMPTKTFSNSQKRRSEDDNIGHVQPAEDDIKLKFVTKEGLVVKIYQKQITRVNVDAIVNAANDTLGNYGGVAEVISRAAGHDMERECKELIRTNRKLRDAQCEVTSAGNLRHKGIIHAVGPRWSTYQRKSRCLDVLVETIVNILNAAKVNRFQTVAMPPISSGIFAVPKKMCAAMYLKGIFEFSKNCNLGSLKEFHIIDITDEVLDLVKDWYTKYLLNPACIEIEAVLLKMSDTGSYLDDKRYGQAGYGPSHGKHDGKYDRNGREVAANAAAHGSTKIIRNFCEKTDIHIYTKDILRLINVDVIVVSEDGFIKGEEDCRKLC
ncbi:unnamed protein product [Mytilus edulis]|uniref:Macro domain-containing protein n=1 Tax=Mytilus edulis TaxID=6550 RepID=A0A8S3TED1_MYTED|nr:unnamed protein product [Mytilus edulis]